MLYSEQELKRDLAQVEDYFQKKMRQLKVGRATPDMFEDLMVEAYEQQMQLKGVASISIEKATAVVIQPWDKTLVDAIVESINKSGLEYSPVSEGDKVRLNIPPLTEETRKNTVKELKQMLEEAKISVRQVRHKYMDQVNKAEGVSEDEQSRDKDTIQKYIDEQVKTFDQLSAEKETELMSL